MARPDFYKVLILRTIGNFLVLMSLFMIVKTFYQPVREEIRFALDKINKKEYLVAGSPKIEKIKRDYSSDLEEGGLSQALKAKNIEILVPKDANFSIVVPKIAANANVISNVDSSDDKAYLEALKHGVAHAAGSSFPGQGGHIFLFAHSTDYFWNVGTYNAVFYLLTKLEKGDEINLFYKGQRYVYKVVDQTIINPDEVDYLTRKTDVEFLTLQTCWPAGTTLKRLLVFARRVVE